MGPSENNKVIAYNNTTNLFELKEDSTFIDAPDNQRYVRTLGNWEPEKKLLGDLENTDVSGAVNKDILWFNGIDWESTPNYLDELADTAITKNLGEDGKFIKYDFLQNKFVLDTVSSQLRDLTDTNFNLPGDDQKYI